MGGIPWLVLISILHRWVQYMGMDRTDNWGPELYNPPLGHSDLVVMLSYGMSGALILLTGLYG